MDKADLFRKALVKICNLEKENKMLTNEPIAIISSACLFPGNVGSSESFWELLDNKRLGLDDVPAERWDAHKYYDPDPSKPNKIAIKQLNFLRESIKQFDAKFFKITSTEARSIDPQHRLLLKLTWQAIERACINPLSLRGSSTGVYIGIINSEYLPFITESQALAPYAMTGCNPHMASGRIAHFFDFKGPAISIDTACSSSLIALHQACNSLRSKEIDLAVVGGVNLIINVFTLLSLSKLDALSQDGLSKSFDESANGYGRGEGCGILLIKRLSDALREKDHILGVVRSSAINSDGQTPGIVVPDKNAQIKVMESALKKGSLNPSEIHHIEAHGTGTPVGDPLEVEAIENCYLSKNNLITIGSCKANIGHLEAAAGVASIISALEIIKNKAVPPNALLKKINPKIENLKGHFPTITKPIKTEIPIRVGINGFGFSGTNAHVIIEEGPKNEEASDNFCLEKSFYSLLISAQTRDSLLKLIKSYHRFFYEKKVNASLIDLEANMFLTRACLKYSVILQVRNFKELETSIHKLSSIANPKELPIVYQKNYRLAVVLPNFSDCQKIYSLKEKFGMILSKYTKHLHFSSVNQEEIKVALYVYIAIYSFFEEAQISYNEIVCQDTLALVAFLLFKEKINEESIERYVSKDEKINEDVSDLNLIFNGLKILKESCLSDFKYTVSLETNENKLLLFFRQQLDSLSKEGMIYWNTTHEGLVNAIIYLYALKFNVNQKFLFSLYPHWKKIELPTYTFDEKPYWYDEAGPVTQQSDIFQRDRIEYRVIEVPIDTFFGQYFIGSDIIQELKDTHSIVHVGYLQQLAFDFLEKHTSKNALSIYKASFKLALSVRNDNQHLIGIGNKKGNLLSFAIKAKVANQWFEHFSCEFHLDENNLLRHKNSIPDLASFNTRFLEEEGASLFYSMLLKRGVELGDSVKLVSRFKISKKNTLITAQIDLPPLKKSHPGIFDALAQLFHLFLDSKDSSKLMVYSWELAKYIGQLDSQKYFCVIEKVDETDTKILGNVFLYNDEKKCIYFVKNQCMIKMLSNAIQSTSSEMTANILEDFKKLKKEGEKSAFLDNFVIETISSILNLDIDEIDLKDKIFDIGFDSITSAQLKGYIYNNLKLDLDQTLLFSNPSLEEISRRLYSQLTPKNQTHHHFQIQSEQTKEEDLNQWIKGNVEQNDLPVLFCFPYGGGDSSIYQSWPNLLKRSCQVVLIQLPGRGPRIHESPISDIDELVTTLLKVIKSLELKNYYFYGHSMGAYIAYELGKRIEVDKTMISPLEIFISAAAAPSAKQIPWAHQAERLIKLLEEISNDKKTESIKSSILSELDNGDEIEEILQVADVELIKSLIPSLRADLKIVNSFHKQTHNKISIPLCAVCGLSDSRIKVSRVRDWERFTSKQFSLYEVTGNHFFLQKKQNQKDVLKIIEDRMKKSYQHKEQLV